ncbi:MAG TPA: ribosome maturation factor RimP [Candidatus Berkiella sp.]|nr:ribosome maturation factor RimP [Candidatus Berkiella sp.]
MHQQTKWHDLIGPVIQGTPFELVGVECVGGGKHTVVRIYMDKQGGITIDDIVELTRQISVIFDVEEPIKGQYTLEVSSPGLQRPLFLPTHFHNQVGQKITVRTSHALGNRQNFKGTLVKADDDGIEMVVDEQNISFQYNDIDKAKVLPDIGIGSRDEKEAKR